MMLGKNALIFQERKWHRKIEYAGSEKYKSYGWDAQPSEEKC